LLVPAIIITMMIFCTLSERERRASHPERASSALQAPPGRPVPGSKLDPQVRPIPVPSLRNLAIHDGTKQG
jgi:hypothetical protein